ncbi:hydrolase [Coleophoma cylindrospora]|uniref:Hydrolase n=1 Tax=Coleophoma cylindrospora TaxID=1849047 RepID=A0A3D8RAU4_9HELO|nr:hydrolase [Coleophoma cylindrospora]
MVEITEGTHQIGDVSLYTKTWKPDGPAKAKVVFVHGFNDHINRYCEFFPTLASRGIEVHGFDQRGWGRSVKKSADRGNTGPTPQVMSDIVTFIKAQLPSPVPVFVMGHSMGGAQVLSLASDPLYEDLMPSIQGWLTESAFLRFPKGQEPPGLKVVLGRLAGRLLPRFQLFAALPAENLSRDPEVVKSVLDDKLLHGYGTLQQLANMLDRAAALDAGRAKLNKGVKSLWISHGTGDKGTSCEASEAWFARQTHVQDKELKLYDGWYHMLHCDLPSNREEFYNDVANWILARSGTEEPRQVAESKL